jgi:uncharacterized protein YegL
MSYTAEISRTHPSCFVFLIDQSGSMQEGWAGEAGKNKAEGLSTIINRLLQNLVLKCAKSEGVRDYYDVGVIGYGATVGPAFSGALAGKELVPVGEIANQPARIEERSKKVDDGAGGILDQNIKFPIWFDAIANGGTPMCQAMARAQSILNRWVTEQPTSFPPIVINITDGQATDGDPAAAANALKDLKTEDGHVLLFNIHVSSTPSSPIEFPSNESGLPDDYAKLLFRMSSTLPDYMKVIAGEEGFPIGDSPRGFVFNGDMVSVIRFLDIGTRATSLR